MSESFPPRPFGPPVPKPVDLTGALMPVHEDGQPVLLDMPGNLSQKLFLPVFTTPEAYQVFLGMKAATPARAAVILDGPDFLASIPSDIRVVVDVRPHDDPVKRAAGCVRFVEIQR